MEGDSKVRPGRVCAVLTRPSRREADEPGLQLPSRSPPVSMARVVWAGLRDEPVCLLSIIVGTAVSYGTPAPWFHWCGEIFVRNECKSQFICYLVIKYFIEIINSSTQRWQPRDVFHISTMPVLLVLMHWCCEVVLIVRRSWYNFK